MNAARSLVATAKALLPPGKGLLAIDESITTCNKRFAKLGIAQTEEMRRAYRELLICTSGLNSVEVVPDQKDLLIFNSLHEDSTGSHEEALLKIYQRLRPGNPPQLEKARSLFVENPLAAFNGRSLPHVPEVPDDLTRPRRKRLFFF